MTEIAIYGAGGLGRETALLVRQIIQVQNNWNLVGFYDDSMSPGTRLDGVSVLGNMSDLNQTRSPLSIAVAVSDPETRDSIVKRIENPNIMFPVLVHPACNLGEFNMVGKGCILTAGVILTTGITLGEFVIINLSSTIGHDVTIGSYTSVMPGVSISGNVRIGSHTLIGTGGKILQNLSIGKQCKVGAGAVVTKNFGDSRTLVGIPAHEK